MLVSDFLAADLAGQQAAWYDWFCSDEGCKSRMKRWAQFVAILHAKFGSKFNHCEVFWKQNPGWHGNADTDTTLIQLYETDYPAGSQRICMSLCRETVKSRGWGKTESKVTWRYGLEMWSEGKDFPNEPQIMVDTITEFKKALKAYK